MKTSLFLRHLILASLVFSAFSISATAQAKDKGPKLNFPADMPVNLNWRKWASTPEGLQFSTQVTRDRGDKLEDGAHLHFAPTSVSGKQLQTTILMLPVRTLNRPGITGFRKRHHHGAYRKASADVQVILPAATNEVDVRYCTSSH